MKPFFLRFLPALIVSGGVTVSLGVGAAMARSAKQAWRQDAIYQAGGLTTRLFDHVNVLSYQLNSLNILYENSTEVNHDAFMDAVELLELQHHPLPLRNITYLADGVVVQRSEVLSPLAAGARLPDDPAWAKLAADCAEHPGGICMNPDIRMGGRRWLVLMVQLRPRAGRNDALLAMTDFDSFLSEFKSLHVPPGLSLEIGQGGGVDKGRIGERIIEIREAGQHRFELAWTPSSDFAGGPNYFPAVWAAVAGTAVSVFLGVLIQSLLGRQREVAARVDEATAQLQRAKTEAEAANRAKGAFLAAMSHEIRTPMNAVLNMVGTVLESSKVEGEQREYLKVADSSARHLLSVINDILDFSKIESGKLEIEDIPFSLHGLLEGVSDLFRVKVAESHVELVLDIVPGTPDGVRGDPTRLRQVLVNLVGNAFKFTAKGQVVLHAQAEGGELRLSVADSGIGIPPEQQAKLFQPFVQADAATTRRFGGTGLGLTISRRLAQLMGGSIALSSVEGEGSLFTVSVPLMADAAGDRGELRLPLALMGRGILLVEDNAASREAMRVMFEQHGLPCVSFPAVEPALEWLKSPAASDVGAAVVDWSLPEGGMDGLAGISELRRVRAGLPCFLVSAFADRQVQERAKSSGAAAFIPKPVTWGAVHAALQRSLASPEVAPLAPQVAVSFDGVLALVAEDNKQNQLVAKVLLKKMGITVEVADNGKVALGMAQADPGKYQIILMDMQMPEMDGLEATRQIRSLPACKTIPIIAMTANAMKSDLDACLEAGMNDWVVKPIDKQKLLETLRKALK